MFQDCCKVETNWETEVKRLGELIGSRNQRQIHPTQTQPFLGFVQNFCPKHVFWVVLLSGLARVERLKPRLRLSERGWTDWEWEGGRNGRRRTRPAVPLLLAGPNLALLPTQSHPRSIANINYTLHYTPPQTKTSTTPKASTTKSFNLGPQSQLLCRPNLHIASSKRNITPVLRHLSLGN